MASIETSLSLTPIQADELDLFYKIETAAHTHPWSQSVFYSLPDKKNWHGLGLWIDQENRSEPIGFCILSIVADEAEILDIVIDPKQQSKGYGRFLLNEAEKWALERRASTLYLEVRQSNLPAIQLYHHHGFNEVGVRPNYYPAQEGREDALLFAKECIPD